MLFVGCSDDGKTSSSTIAECGDPPPPVEYTVLGYEVSFNKLVSGEDVESEVEPEDFVINLTSEIESYTKSADVFLWPKFSLFERAYACSVHPEQIPTQIMETFTVTSTGSFGDNYPPGENLIELFLALESSPAGSVNKPIQSSKMLLRAVPVDENHIFTVTIELDDGLFFSQSSNNIAFKISPE